MENTNRIQGESFDDYTLRMIKSRTENGFEYDELYELLFGEEFSVSPTESRKRTKGVQDYLLCKQKMENVENGREIARLSEKESIEIKADNSRILEKFVLACEEDFKTPEKILSLLGYDHKAWEITSSKLSKWNVSGGAGNAHKLLYSVKATVKPRTCEFDVEWMVDVIKNIDLSGIELKKSSHSNKDGYVVEVNFADAHLGKYVSVLVAKDNYNLEIAKKAYLGMIDEAIDRVSHLKVKKFVFVFGQDYINVDTPKGTTRETRQDMDRFFDEIYRTGYEVLIKSVEKLRIIAPVEAIYVKGNHDSQSTFTMAVGLESLYKAQGIDEVTVDSSSHQRKYRRFGNVAIGYSHGDKEKSRIFDCMQIDRPDLLVCKTKEFHMSHFHEESTKTKAGIVYRRLNSPSASCLWTWESGYGGSQKVGNLYVYDEVNGLKSQEYIWAK